MTPERIREIVAKMNVPEDIKVVLMQQALSGNRSALFFLVGFAKRQGI